MQTVCTPSSGIGFATEVEVGGGLELLHQVGHLESEVKYDMTQI